MFFSISNLTIIYMIVVVIFFNGYSDGSIEKCEGELKPLGFIKDHSALNNLTVILDGKFRMVSNPKKYFKNSKDLEKYAKNAEKTIGLHFNNKNIIDFENTKYASRYILHLKMHILDPDYMLSILTWCEINVFNEDDIPVFIRDESASEYKEEDKYNNSYLKRIANNTGLPRKNKLVVFKTLRVCLKETLNLKKISVGYPFKTYGRNYISDKGNVRNLKPLSWCATRVCYDSLIKFGFKDSTVQTNIDLLLHKQSKLTESYDGRYAYHFYKYLQEVNKKEDNYYQIVSPYESKMSIHFGYLRNWCSVQVCYDDLIAAGFIYWHASDNYKYVYPKYKNENYPMFVSEYVVNYCTHLNHVSTSRGLGYLGNSRLHESYTISENAEPRSPIDFCKFHIIKLNLSYYSYIKK